MDSAKFPSSEPTVNDLIIGGERVQSYRCSARLTKELPSELLQHIIFYAIEESSRKHQRDSSAVGQLMVTIASLNTAFGQLILSPHAMDTFLRSTNHPGTFHYIPFCFGLNPASNDVLTTAGTGTGTGTQNTEKKTELNEEQTLAQDLYLTCLENESQGPETSHPSSLVLNTKYNNKISFEKNLEKLESLAKHPLFHKFHSKGSYVYLISNVLKNKIENVTDPRLIIRVWTLFAQTCEPAYKADRNHYQHPELNIFLEKLTKATTKSSSNFHPDTFENLLESLVCVCQTLPDLLEQEHHLSVTSDTPYSPSPLAQKMDEQKGVLKDLICAVLIAIDPKKINLKINYSIQGLSLDASKKLFIAFRDGGNQTQCSRYMISWARYNQGQLADIIYAFWTDYLIFLRNLAQNSQNIPEIFDVDQDTADTIISDYVQCVKEALESLVQRGIRKRDIPHFEALQSLEKR